MSKEIGEGYNIVKKDGKSILLKTMISQKVVELTGVTRSLP